MQNELFTDDWGVDAEDWGGGDDMLISKDAAVDDVVNGMQNIEISEVSVSKGSSFKFNSN